MTEGSPPDGRPAEPRRLRVRGSPAPGESNLGFRLRLAEANGYARLEDVKAHQLPEAGPGWDGTPDGVVAELERATMFRFGTFHIDVRGCRLCPACLGESPHARLVWHLADWVVCARHGCRMLTSCPGCSRLLTWRRGRVASCGCGQDLRDAEPCPAPIPSIRLAAVLDGACGPDGRSRVRVPPERIEELGPVDLLRMVGLFKDLLEAHRADPATRPGPAQAWPEGFDAVADLLWDWPVRFDGFIGQRFGERLYERSEKYADIAYLRGANDPTIEKILGFAGDPRHFLSAEIARFLGAGDPAQAASAPGATGLDTPCPIHQAARLVGVEIGEAERLVREGALAATVVPMRRHDQVHVVPAELRRLAQWRPKGFSPAVRDAIGAGGLISRTEAKNETGLENHELKGLLEGGLLGPGFSVRSQRFYERHAITGLLAEFRSMNPEGLPTLGLQGRQEAGLHDMAEIAAMYVEELSAVIRVLLDNRVRAVALARKSSGLRAYLYDARTIGHLLPIPRPGAGDRP